jgi:hypothetical protein
MADAYQIWLKEVKDALRSINMPMEDWQGVWPFAFSAQYKAGTKPDDAALKANRYWRHEQNKSLKQDCCLTLDCWLPRGHQGECQSCSIDGREEPRLMSSLEEAARHLLDSISESPNFNPNKLARVAGQFITPNGNKVHPVQMNGRTVYVTIPED